jgi:hypothetical protein
MTASLLPGALADDRFGALEQVVVDRLAQLPVSAVLVCLLGNVHSSALPALAWQFGARGSAWQVADEMGRRVLLRRAIERTRHKGTAFAVRDALDAVDYTASVQHQRAIYRDGAISHDGHWAHAQASERDYWILVAGEITSEQGQAVLAIAREWGRFTTTPKVFWAASSDAPIGEWNAVA